MSLAKKYKFGGNQPSFFIIIMSLLLLLFNYFLSELWVLSLFWFIKLFVHFCLVSVWKLVDIGVSEHLSKRLRGWKGPPVEMPRFNRKVEEEVKVLDHQHGPDAHDLPWRLSQRHKCQHRTVEHAKWIEVAEYILFQDLPSCQTIKTYICLRVTHIQLLFDLSVLAFDVGIDLWHLLHAPQLLCDTAFKPLFGPPYKRCHIFRNLRGEDWLTVLTRCGGLGARGDWH